MKLPKRVYVVWSDPTSHSEWKDRKKAEKLDCSSCQTVGFLVNKDKNMLRVALSCSIDGAMDENIEFGDTIVIPVKLVKKFKYIRSKL